MSTHPTSSSSTTLPPEKTNAAARSDEKISDDIVAARHSTDMSGGVSGVTRHHGQEDEIKQHMTGDHTSNLERKDAASAQSPSTAAHDTSLVSSEQALTKASTDAVAAAPADATATQEGGITQTEITHSGQAATGAAGAPVRGRVHAFRVNSSRFIVDAKYLPLRPLGRGAYGVVCSAIDQDTNRKVAIKKIGNAFDDVVDAKRILREVKMLHHFQHENIIGLVDLVEPPPGYPFKDVYMVLEFMETDLHKIIYSRNELTDDHVQYFVYQALRALKYIHSAQVVHRDLKPSNLLLNGNCDLKICDFGLARGLDEASPDTHLTEYVVTRWYRAPEVMYSVQDYSYQIDVWALGCILAELLGRAPLWPGEDYIKQMNLIFDVLGTPSEEDMSVITNARALTYIRSLPPRPRVPWRQLFPHASDLSLDLLDKMLQFNPARRITVAQALEHPYFADLRNPESETECAHAFDYSFERDGRTREDLQRFMWDEIYAYRPWLKGQRGRGRDDDDEAAVAAAQGQEGETQVAASGTDAAAQAQAPGAVPVAATAAAAAPVRPASTSTSTSTSTTTQPSGTVPAVPHGTTTSQVVQGNGGAVSASGHTVTAAQGGVTAGAARGSVGDHTSG